MSTRTLHVDLLARVEGEGALELEIEGRQVAAARLRIFEPPRLFEALLRGRDHREAPDITARICGICPIAYQIGAAQAMESALGLRLDARSRTLRRLLYCGEWIESHALHIVMLHAPDFLGFPDAIRMAHEHREAVVAGLELKKIGNEIIRTLGGREIHPVNVRVGGLHRVPSRTELAPLAARLEAARAHAIGLLRWASGFRFPDLQRDYEFVSLRAAQGYPIEEGRIVSSSGLDIGIGEFDAHFEERQVAHSTALHAALKGRGGYLVGPLARYALNFDRLPPDVQSLAREAGLGPVCRNPFRSILVRAIEVVYACGEALRLVAQADLEPPQAATAGAPRAAVGCGCTEAPRGLCHHRYEIGEDGAIVAARIVPPTSQNQSSIEEDLRALATQHVDAPDEELRWLCERAIRNHDPCISCSAHFLDLTVRRR